MKGKQETSNQDHVAEKIDFKRSEQVRLLYMQALVSNSVIILISIIYYFLLRHRLSSTLILTWLVLLLILASYRLFLWISQKSRPKSRPTEFWLSRYAIACGLVGTVWSLIYPSLINSNDPLVFASLLILAFGVMSSAVPILSACIPAFILYTYPQGVTLVATLCCMEDANYSWVALAVVVYLLMLTLFARNTNISIFKSIQLEYQNRSLIEDLNVEISQRETLIEQRTHELKKKNEELIHEVKGRQNVEEELRSSESKYRELIESTPDLRYRTDNSGKIIFMSPSVKKMSGYSAEELIGMRMEGFYVRPKERENVIALLQRDGFVTEYEAQLKRKDGSVWWASTNAQVFKNSAGDIIGVEGVTRDVTERKKMEAVLVETKERLSAFMDSATDGFILLDANFRYIEINKAALEITGLQKNDVLGKRLADVIPDIENTSRYQGYQRVIDTGQPYHAVDVIHPTLKGDKSIELKAFKVGNGLGLIVTDVTARRQAEDEKNVLEAQLHQAQKLESIGTLAGGVAHEFNNMLAVILGYNEILMEEFSHVSQIRESTEEIRTAGTRARDVVKQLLTFSRQEDVVTEVLDLKSVIEASIKLIRSTTPVNIKIEKQLLADSCSVLGNETQINQLLINLCNNGVDALPEQGGVITISLFNETINKRQDTHPAQLETGEYVTLMVGDNGAGINGEILNRIFEPYYTTKEIGEGTGIGLAIVHGIVERHGGVIMADSKPGRGTMFTIYFPVCEGSVVKETGRRNELPVGDENILYVDDEESIARVGTRLLENLGYTVESKTNSLEALQLVKNDPNKFDLLITDMAMPHMTGDQLIIETLKIRPDMPTIICTGYSSKVSENEALSIGARSFIMKPVRKSELAKTVRTVLDE